MANNIKAATFKEIWSKEDLCSKCSLLGHKNTDCKFNVFCNTCCQDHTTLLHCIQPMVSCSMKMRHAANYISLQDIPVDKESRTFSCLL